MPAHYGKPLRGGGKKAKPGDKTRMVQKKKGSPGGPGRIPTPKPQPEGPALSRKPKKGPKVGVTRPRPRPGSPVKPRPVRGR